MSSRSCLRAALLLGSWLLGLGAAPAALAQAPEPSVARHWDEALLEAIRLDYPAPTVHSRNLFHVSAAMWDAWAAYDPVAEGVFVHEKLTAGDVQAAREKAISFAAYRILRHRFVAPKSSPGAVSMTPAIFDGVMDELGYDKGFTATSGDVDPAAELGNRIAAAIIAHGSNDGANEDHPSAPYSDPTYTPLNDPLVVDLPGVTQPFVPGGQPPELPEPNHWQPLSLDYSVTQNGIILGATIQTFLGAGWGGVTPFAMVRENEEDVYDDPGPPPLLGCPGDVLPCDGDTAFKAAVVRLIEFASRLDPDDGAMIDVSPGAIGNNPLGTNDGTGHDSNPATGLPYEPNVVKRGDWQRVVGEFWADGPRSETPPGHWNTIANYVTDHPLFERRYRGEGEIVDALEWDVKLYLAVNGAVYDAAIAAWDAKRKYDYVRPVTMIRYMGGKGQSSDPLGPSYHPKGLPLVPDLIEVVTEESTAPGGKHEGVINRNSSGQVLPAPPIGQIAIRVWKGQPAVPETQYSGVDWIRAVDWLPYLPSTFVTPPFAAYTSGHSTFSRAGAEVLTRFTGSEFFPGGLGSFLATQNTFLRVEDGPSEDVELQWATYYDSADQAGISRLLIGIHVPADDFGGRNMGSQIGIDAFEKAEQFFLPEPGALAQAAAALLALTTLARRRRAS